MEYLTETHELMEREMEVRRAKLAPLVDNTASLWLKLEPKLTKAQDKYLHADDLSVNKLEVPCSPDMSAMCGLESRRCDAHTPGVFLSCCPASREKQ